MNNKGLTIIRKVLNIISFSLIFGVIALFVVMCAKSTKYQYINGDYKYYNDGWSLVLDNGDLLPLDGTNAPNEYKYKTCSFVRTIDDISVDTKMFLTTRTRLKVEVDGEVRYQVDAYESPLPTRTVKDVYHCIQLYRQDSGKQLVITYYDDHYPNNRLGEVIVGDSLQGFRILFTKYGLPFVLSLILMFMAVVIIIINIILNIRYKNRIQAYVLGLGIFMVALWDIVAGLNFQLLFGITVIDGLTGFLITMLLPLPFMYHMNKLQNYRYSKVHYAIQALLLINFCVFTCMNFFGKTTFKDNLLYIDLVVGFALFVLIITIAIDWIKKRVNKYREIAIGYMGLIIFSMLDIIVINAPLPFDLVDGICIILGLYFLQGMAVLSIFREMSASYLKGKEAIQASQQKSNFLANMSHEIRTPINTVLGLDTMIIRESKEANIVKYAKGIQNSGKTLLSLINDILDFSKIESGKMELVYEEYQLASVINDIVNMMRPKAEEKNLDFILDIDESIPSMLYGDEVRIKQIIINLLTNAVKYTHEGSVILKVGAACKEKTVDLTVAVKDTGIGIKPEDIKKLSEKFVRIEESRNKNIEGTGLGMNIVINLLQLMDSKIEVDSVYGKGSDFHFTISQEIKDHRPIGKLDDVLTNIEDDDNHVVSFCIPDSRLLVVDDNAMNRNVFVNLLKDMHCPIDEAESGKQCLELVEKEKYDIIFMDHMMPEMDGVETFRCMKEMGEYLNADTPVIILTANAISGAKEEYLAEGFNGYLSKPIDVEKLEEMIGEMIPDAKKKSVKKAENESEVKEISVELPFIDGVDWESAIQKLRSEKLLQDSIAVFATTAKSDLEALKKLFDTLLSDNSEESYSAYRIKVHSMKSNAGTIGANHVAGLAKYLEYAARDMDLQTIKNVMPLFEKEWSTLKQSIDEMLPQKEVYDGEKPEIADGELFAMLDTLVEAVNEIDFDRMDAIMEILSEYSYSPNRKELMQELNAAVLNVDKGQCLEVVSKLKTMCYERND